MTVATVARARDGFSLIELMVAVVLLAVGLLSMAGMSSYAMTRIRMTKVDTRRAAVVASTIEQLRAKMADRTGFDSVAAVPASTPITMQGYKVWYDITDVGPDFDLKTITIYTEGVGYRAGWQTAARDTFVVTFARPMR
ncbi:MAG: prepilin-type N-terminal cleavage/methylation domain-containing protein [Gemmatimonadetes bacterium]|nr:prepilin-type N-terminal cleavage/methylation domain-containing protein [Gemmatimonadota bacterium]